MTPADIAGKVYDALAAHQALTEEARSKHGTAWWHYAPDRADTCRRLLRDLSAARPGELFVGLMSVLEDQSRNGRPGRLWEQGLVGMLLLRFLPPCPLPLEDVVRRHLPTYDLSLKHLPWYLALVFGRDATRCRIQAMLAAEPDERRRILLKGFMYWLGWEGNDDERFRVLFVDQCPRCRYPLGGSENPCPDCGEKSPWGDRATGPDD